MSMVSLLLLMLSGPNEAKSFMLIDLFVGSDAPFRESILVHLSALFVFVSARAVT